MGVTWLRYTIDLLGMLPQYPPKPNPLDASNKPTHPHTRRLVVVCMHSSSKVKVKF